MHANERGRRTGLRGVAGRAGDPHARLSRRAPLVCIILAATDSGTQQRRYCRERRMESGRIGLELTYCSGELRLHLAHEAFHRPEQLIEVAVAMEIDLESLEAGCLSVTQ